MKKNSFFLIISFFGLCVVTGTSFADISSRDDLLEPSGETPAEERAHSTSRDVGGERLRTEDPREHSVAHNTHQATKSIAHNTHQATKSILHNTHQGTKKVVHTTTDGIKEGAGFVTGSIAEGVSAGTGAVSDFFNKIGGN